jgi:Cof subfamily protein (haloacid dehalogenase superfamily)
MNPYALFLDIDRTLTAENNIVPKRNIEALKKARELGHKVIINTGRSYGNIPKEIFEQIEFDGVVSGNGSALMLNGETLYADFIEKSVFEKIASFCFDNEDYWAVFEGFKRSYTTAGRGRELSSSDIPVSSLKELLELSKDDNFQVIAVSSNFSKDFLEKLSNNITYYTFDYYYDLTAKGNNKANGMLKLLEIMNIPQSQSMAFGDSENDFNMLKCAGVGVAVANAQPDVLEIADYVTLSNKDGGVGAAIEKYLLKGN